MSLVSTPLQPKQERSTVTRRRILDAAVEELLASGPVAFTTNAVAERARVTRGAQQHHFPRREVLLAEAVRHLAERQRYALRTQIGTVPPGRARLRRALDVIYELYSGPLFGATLELSLAAQRVPSLKALVAEHERIINRELIAAADGLLDQEAVGQQTSRERWAMALATIRGIALLRLLDEPPARIAKHWAHAAGELVELLTRP
jgi:AcrR family transcriptional regulator